MRWSGGMRHNKDRKKGQMPDISSAFSMPTAFTLDKTFIPVTYRVITLHECAE